MWKHHEIIYTWTPSKLNKIRYFRKLLDKLAILKIPDFQSCRALKFMYQISDQLVLCNHVIRYLIKYLWFNALDKISETLKMNKCFLLILKICWKPCSWKDCQSVKYKTRLDSNSEVLSPHPSSLFFFKFRTGVIFLILLYFKFFFMEKFS